MIRSLLCIQHVISVVHSKSFIDLVYVMSPGANLVLWGDCPCVYQIIVIVVLNVNGVIFMYSYNYMRTVLLFFFEIHPLHHFQYQVPCTLVVVTLCLAFVFCITNYLYMQQCKVCWISYLCKIMSHWEWIEYFIEPVVLCSLIIYNLSGQYGGLLINVHK